MNSRGGFHGDGDAVTEIQYTKTNDIQHIENLSTSWVRGEKFKTELPKLPQRVEILVKDIDEEAKYFYLEKVGYDYIIFKWKGMKLTIYESYI